MFLGIFKKQHKNYIKFQSETKVSILPSWYRSDTDTVLVSIFLILLLSEFTTCSLEQETFNPFASFTYKDFPHLLTDQIKLRVD